MSTSGPAQSASFPFPTQVVYDGTSDRLRAAVDVAPAATDDVTVEVGSRRLRIAVDRGDSVEVGDQHGDEQTASDDRIVERTVTPLPPGLEFGDDRHAFYNNGVLTVSLETQS
ncbi:Hsp20/alpha crystallin family protein [Natrinema thermotolerans]|uniref:Hsp20/alpha crystallin family protein n=1 Tax=Natrinema thermotolerans TaxID=121872 RepID=A0AAF0SXL9_9EURY|nr:Hsp20/alpha crystallin family protein [Natrinema thermotolerans]QCC59261.1 Hsp20/alpha crystallin family protein [Natrinema thermotolerans]WMT06226.1 Hsp20/alpha crystallin family protein [Natrinema thermotolerans]